MYITKQTNCSLDDIYIELNKQIVVCVICIELNKLIVVWVICIN